MTDKKILIFYCNNQNPKAMWRTGKTTEDLQPTNLTIYIWLQLLDDFHCWWSNVILNMDSKQWNWTLWD